MNRRDDLRPRVAVVGGGITGLSAAWRLKRAGVACTVFEASTRCGGKILTEQSDGYTLELGADAILLRKPWARQLANELGLDDRVVPVNRPPVLTYVLHRTRCVPLPDGLALLAPSKWRPFLRSPLFSPWGKLRVALEPMIPPRRDDADESLADFVRRRFGEELLDRVAEPMLCGVFNGQAERQSILATFPQFRRFEREHGSVIRGLRAARREPDADPPAPFFSLVGGAGELIDALARELADTIELRTKVTRIDRLRDGLFDVRTSPARVRGDLPVSARDSSFDAVILTTPAGVAADAIETLAPSAARELRRIGFTGIGSIYLAFHRGDVPHPLDAYGLVIPRRAARPIDGMTWTSTKWPDRAPEGIALIRVFFGGPNSRDSLDLPDDRLRAMARRELGEILGVTAEPLFWRAHRWFDAYPRYDVGHLAVVDAIERALPPGVVVAGCSYRGVGVPDCVHQGAAAAQRTIEYLKRIKP